MTRRIDDEDLAGITGGGDAQIGDEPSGGSLTGKVKHPRDVGVERPPTTTDGGGDDEPASIDRDL